MVRDYGSPMIGMWPYSGRTAHQPKTAIAKATPFTRNRSEMLRGSITALITPFANGALDEKAFSHFVDWQINEGSHGLVPVGTTGESPTVSHEEHRRVIEICVEVTAKRVPVIAGAGSNSTSEAVSLARFAEDIGADVVLSVVPYYNKPTQEGMFQHFSAVASATSLPICSTRCRAAPSPT